MSDLIAAISVELGAYMEREHPALIVEKMPRSIPTEIVVEILHLVLRNLGAHDPEAALSPPRPAPPKDPNRCAWCGWPLAEKLTEGCVRGNCSQRPLPKTFYDAERAQAERKSRAEGKL